MRLRVRAEQPTPGWKTRYPVRPGAEGTVDEFAHGHGMRRCRYRGRSKVHVQHVLTAIDIDIERPSGLPPTEGALLPRQDRARTPGSRVRRGPPGKGGAPGRRGAGGGD
ncbi:MULTISPECIES: transposase [unclassified Streptomyces]|uniref:transposase n=1 Tax=unclassified Streptomyces TaxID=2593676 RepID=UPI0035D76C63